MKEKYIKISFLLMSILIIVFACVFTFLNVTYYGGVMKINLLVGTFSLLMPIYYGFRQKMYKLRMSIFLFSVFVLIISLFMFSIPEYTYEEAVSNLKNQVDGDYTQMNIKHTIEPSFFYTGKYKIKVGGLIYSYSLSGNNYKILKEE